MMYVLLYELHCEVLVEQSKVAVELILQIQTAEKIEPGNEILGHFSYQAICYHFYQYKLITLV